jgi:hypothetical protein
MEQQFINKFTITFEMYKEWANNPVGKTAIENRAKSKRIRFIGIACAGLLIILGVIMSEYYVLLMGAACLLFYLYRIFFTTNKFILKQYEVVLKTQNNNQWIRTINFTDKIIAEDGRMTTQFEYPEIIRVSEDNSYFYLYINADMIIRVRKDSFTQGSPDDFRAFINDARSKAK